MSQRDFPNLKWINESLLLLYRSLKPTLIKKEFSGNLIPELIINSAWTDPIISTQALARHIALQFQLSVTTVLVTFTYNLPVAGRVELSNSNDFFVELDAEHQSEPDCIGAILSHEIAHIFLHRHRISLEPDAHNEVLTDTAATYLGCGLLVMNAAWRSRNRKAARHFGYLTLPEFGYLLAKRDLFFGDDSSQFFSPGIKLEAYHAGRQRLSSECEKRPFVPRQEPARLTSWIQNKVTKKNSDGSQSTAIVFVCPCCTQSLRIPSSGNVLAVRCPTCDSRFRCYP